MVVDSIQPIDSVQRIHSRVTGKLYKGHGITAASASIPSKYQTIVTNNADKRGFCAQAKRFSDDYYINDIPGPGNYKCPHGEIEKISTSFSKKGTGSFASKTQRANKSHYNGSTPGAGSYNLPSLLSTRKEFNRANSSSFHTPIALTTKDTMVGPVRAPAPNVYNVQNTSMGKKFGVGAEAAFKSKTTRQVIPVGSTRVPSPSHYNIHDEGTRPTAKGPTSIFSSTTKREVISKPLDVPGPGTYKPYHPGSPTNKLTFPRRHYLCISAPAMALPPPIENPGPGSYELVDYDGPAKHYMSSGVFVSNTSRWTFNHRTKEHPGPASYRPERVGKQSFIYNAQNKWIPL